MGDPAYFSVVGGANPHTRDRWGRRKRVDRALAIRQWRGLHDLLSEFGFRIHVIPPDPALPGLVYPANAGVRIGSDFILSNLIATRAAERDVYARIVEAAGLRCRTIARRFEGEADLFPAGGHYLYTSGELRDQRFQFRFGFPPWKRVYGFRSEPAAIDEISRLFPPGPTLRLKLVDEQFYHGDTCLCSYGPHREFLLAWLPALSPESRLLLANVYAKNLTALEESDAMLYAANSFAFSRDDKFYLVLPKGASRQLVRSLRDNGISILTVDVSEFLRKGGGSVKCMIGDLGILPESAP